MIEIDDVSLLVHVDGATTLGALEAALAPKGLTLGVDGHGDATVAGWLAAGAPGTPSLFHDPADHLVAGITATLVNGERLTIAPAPRRAVGPDLVALIVGGHERFAKVDAVHLRVFRKDTRPVREPLPHGVDLDPPLNAGETKMLDAIAHALLRSG